MKLLLEMKHRELPHHITRWFLLDNGNIFAFIWQSPLPLIEVEMTPVEALRSYAIHVSRIGGYEVIDGELAWHRFVSEMEI